MRRLSLRLLLSALFALTAAPRANAFSTAYCEILDPNPKNAPDRLIRIYTSELGAGAYVSEAARACAYYGRGLIYHFMGKYDAAVADYTRASGYMDGFGEAYAARGDAYGALGEHDRAKADYQQAWPLNKDNAIALGNGCWQRAIRGNPLDLALQDCNRALELDKENTAAWDARCLVNYRLGKFAAAISDCDEAVRLLPQVSSNQRAATLYFCGLAKIKNGDTAAGNQDIAAAKNDYPEVAEAYKIFGIGP